MKNIFKSLCKQLHLSKHKVMTGILALTFALSFSSFFAGCSKPQGTPPSTAIQSSITATSSSAQGSNTALTKTFQYDPQPTSFSNESFSLSDVPEFIGRPHVVVNNGKPFFTEEDKSYSTYEFYSNLDSLGRCGVTSACIDKSLMPTEERGNIGSVKPTGWRTAKYDCVDGKYLYNRCHLIGWQLTAENANKRNLITGTRYMNVDGMLPFENMVADYIKETNNHVLYRVTPLYDGNNLVASGVLMEAESIEDNGKGITFCVFCYNVQPGVKINYSNGDSSLDNKTDN